MNGVSESLQVTGFERLVVRAPDQGGSFSGGNGDDIFIGGAGYDSFNVGWGFDSVDGGTGNDGLGLDFNAAASGVTIARSSSGPDFTYSATSGGQILASGQATSIERLSIYDSRFDDVLNGGDGDDYFSLTRGHDIVSGGAGFDQVFTLSTVMVMALILLPSLLEQKNSPLSQRAVMQLFHLPYLQVLKV
ncbi:hypothetical protein E6W36_04800 [Hankyongella ginsenosidimutans]|uniref:Calcium-binding protein n=1 Tax=Hankyongella ginsenosidimutans TaxID=1763828 RepID=A0A4D7C603_9SPHN|nr:hypothetical protein [Hankyongella ginsenosidimutans]QCI79125.1 hypothetical protein E6W36_04800 [Hankyongella ginsenosidimutans]